MHSSRWKWFYVEEKDSSGLTFVTYIFKNLIVSRKYFDVNSSKFRPIVVFERLYGGTLEPV